MHNGMHRPHRHTDQICTCDNPKLTLGEHASRTKRAVLQMYTFAEWEQADLASALVEFCSGDPPAGAAAQEVPADNSMETAAEVRLEAGCICCAAQHAVADGVAMPCRSGTCW